MGLNDLSLAEYENESFAALSFDQETIADKTFTDCTFKDCTFREAILQRCSFHDCLFTDCDLSLAKIPQTSFALPEAVSLLTSLDIVLRQ